jgi:hypothetical protein
VEDTGCSNESASDNWSERAKQERRNAAAQATPPPVPEIVQFLDAWVSNVLSRDAIGKH